MSSKRLSAPIKLDSADQNVVRFVRGLPYVSIQITRATWQDMGGPLELWVELDTNVDGH
jgi:hypothetical protein